MVYPVYFVNSQYDKAWTKHLFNFSNVKFVCHLQSIAVSLEIISNEGVRSVRLLGLLVSIIMSATDSPDTVPCQPFT